MRILYVGTANLTDNASQQRLYYLARHMAARGHAVTACVPDHPDNRAFLEWIPEHCEPAFFPSRLSAVAELSHKARLLRQRRWDVVHCVGVGLRTLLPPVRSEEGPLVIYDFCEFASRHLLMPWWTRVYYRLVEWYMTTQADAAISYSVYLKDRVASRRPDLGDGLLYMPVAFDPADQEGVLDLDAELTSRFGDKKVLLYVGTVHASFQVWELLDLAERLRHRIGDWTIVVVGGGAHLSRFRDMVRQRGLAEMVTTEGFVHPSRIGAYLRTATIFLFPFPPTLQNLGRCPTKSFNYLGANKPVVTNRVGEVAAVFKEKGFYYEPGDIAGFAEACERALEAAESYDNSDEIQNNTWDARGETYREWLQAVFEKRSSKGPLSPDSDD